MWNREYRTGKKKMNGEQETGNRQQRTKKQRTGNSEWGTGNIELEKENRKQEQGTGN